MFFIFEIKIQEALIGLKINYRLTVSLLLALLEINLLDSHFIAATNNSIVYINLHPNNLQSCDIS